MPIRVLVVSDYEDNFNAVRPEGELFIGLHRLGLDVQVMTFGRAPYAQRFREAGLRVIDFHPTKKFQPEAVARIREAILAGDRQILHLFNNKAIINGLRAARDLPVKVLTYRGYTGNIHWWDPSSYLTHLHPRVDAISCVSEAVTEVFSRQLGFPKGKAVTVSKGHDPAWYASVEAADLQALGCPPGRLVVSVVANARRMKGIPYLVEAMALLPADLPLHFLLIGRDLDDDKTLRALEAVGRRRHVTFTGFRHDVLEIVSACDISLLPSVKGEGLSKVLLESLFLGRPTIMTDIAGNRGLAIHGQTALIVPPRDPRAMASALERFATDELFRKKLGAAGRQFIRENYHLDRSVAEMKALYERVLAHR